MINMPMGNDYQGKMANAACLQEIEGDWGTGIRAVNYYSLTARKFNYRAIALPHFKEIYLAVNWLRDSRLTRRHRDFLC